MPRHYWGTLQAYGCDADKCPPDWTSDQSKTQYRFAPRLVQTGHIDNGWHSHK